MKITPIHEVGKGGLHKLASRIFKNGNNALLSYGSFFSCSYCKVTNAGTVFKRCKKDVILVL